jgi:uncharacterized protein YwgA
VVVDPKKAVDLGLLAYILDRAAPFYGRTKLQKTTFLSELKLREENLVGPHFEFYRWLNGPFSQELWAAYELLADRGFAHHPDQPGLTQRGRELAELVSELRKFHSNVKFFDLLDSTLAYCQHRNGEQLLKMVYGLKVRPEHSQTAVKIEDMPMNTIIIAPPQRFSIEMSADLQKLIVAELEITEEDIRRAERESLPKMVEGFLRRLATDDPL